MKKILLLTALFVIASFVLFQSPVFARGNVEKEFPEVAELITYKQTIPVSNTTGDAFTIIETDKIDETADTAKEEASPAPVIKTIRINTNSNSYYSIRYKYGKPEDVPQDVYDALWEIQLEVVNNFTYDYTALRDPRKRVSLYTLEDFYKHGKGVCAGYADFFILLAKEIGATENLYKISGSRSGGGHAWIEYRTENNRYIIDPTWSDDYCYRGEETRKRFRESEAYGRKAFFITYEESKKIFSSQGYTHKTYKINSETPLWNKSADDA